MKSKKIIFFGSGQLGLDALIKLKAEFEVGLVITKNKPSNHRGSMPVYDYCVDQSLKFVTPATKVELDSALDQFFNSDQDVELGVVVDYGIIISEMSILKFKLGILNSHFSLLPGWRGADPITFPLLAGERQTGVTFMMIDRGMDTGKLIKQFKLEIEPEDDQLSLTERLSALSCSKLNSVVNNLFDQRLKPAPQPNKLITYSRMLNKTESVLNPNKPASLLAREIGAFKVWPKLKLNIGGVDCIIKNGYATTECSPKAKLDLCKNCDPSGFDSVEEKVVLSERNEAVASLKEEKLCFTDRAEPEGCKVLRKSSKLGKIKFSNQEIKLSCGRGSYLNITELQPAGKKTMSAADFIRGYIAKS